VDRLCKLNQNLIQCKSPYGVTSLSIKDEGMLWSTEVIVSGKKAEVSFYPKNDKGHYYFLCLVSPAVCPDFRMVYETESNALVLNGEGIPQEIIDREEEWSDRLMEN